MVDSTLRETEPHGTVLFPLRVHEFASDPAIVDRVPAHWHPEIELLVITAGQAVFHLDGISRPVAKADIIFVAPDHLHAFTAPVGTPFAFYAVVFDPSLLASSVADTIQTQYLDPVLQGERRIPSVITPHQFWYETLLMTLTVIREADASAAPGYELMIKAELFLAWQLLFAHSSGSPRETAQDPSQISLVKNVLTYIRTHYDQPLSAGLLARQFHVSESHLCRLYKKNTKTTLTTSITAERLSHAADLLRHTTMPISEVALACGFANISYFNKRFRERMQQTPGAYRAAQRHH
ncbi:helix-turn-helix transcriptional regulator [Lacticaseibacillus yichunensis]|uniref:AraC family transcriptional regulator n=1 Tax=Lacticaseibacillus yichunensis TaxID=2486015 RepID=A0ABW4CQG5_9LACO|nr:AraC family transcriptional regulator [Lacticaseibacillus yichunensis]